MDRKHQSPREYLYVSINLFQVMYSQRVIVLDSKSYSVVKIRHSRCLHTIVEEKEGLANFVYSLLSGHVRRQINL